jgi:hypothetical protein
MAKNMGTIVSTETSVPDPDPDPPDPRVFWPPGSGSTSQSYRSGSGSGSFYHHAKIIKKNLESYYFVTLFDFLSLKNNENVPSKSNKQNSRIRILDPDPDQLVRGMDPRIRTHTKMSWIRNTADN